MAEKNLPYKDKSYLSWNVFIFVKFGFLSHNFGTRNARKSIKGSQDSDYNLVSKIIWTKKMAHCVGGKGQAYLAKKAKTRPHCDVSHRECQTQKWKKKERLSMCFLFVVFVNEFSLSHGGTCVAAAPSVLTELELAFFRTLWRPTAFRDFRKKKHRNACGFAREFFQSGQCYRPGQRLKRHGKSCCLHLKKNFLVGGYGFFVSDVISGGFLGHLDPLHLALGSNH